MPRVRRQPDDRPQRDDPARRGRARPADPRARHVLGGRAVAPARRPADGLLAGDGPPGSGSVLPAPRPGHPAIDRGAGGCPGPSPDRARGHGPAAPPRGWRADRARDRGPGAADGGRGDGRRRRAGIAAPGAGRGRAAPAPRQRDHHRRGRQPRGRPPPGRAQGVTAARGAAGDLRCGRPPGGGDGIALPGRPLRAGRALRDRGSGRKARSGDARPSRQAHQQLGDGSVAVAP